MSNSQITPIIWQYRSSLNYLMIEIKSIPQYNRISAIESVARKYI